MSLFGDEATDAEKRLIFGIVNEFRVLNQANAPTIARRVSNPLTDTERNLDLLTEKGILGKLHNIYYVEKEEVVLDWLIEASRELRIVFEFSET
jgi:hypothetical protein